MAIRIECQACGFKNDLGRVFCTQCGKRLELTHTSLADLAERRTFDWSSLIHRIVFGGVILAVGGAVVAACWRQALSPVPSDPSGAKQIAMKVRAVQSGLRARREIAMPLTEAEVNGLLAARAESRKLQRLTIDFHPGSFTLTAWSRLTPLGQVAGLTNLVVPVSCGLSGRFEGGMVVIQGGRVGHLPLPASLTSLMKPWFKDWLSDDLAQAEMVSALKRATFDETGAQLVFGP